MRENFFFHLEANWQVYLSPCHKLHIERECNYLGYESLLPVFFLIVGFKFGLTSLLMCVINNAELIEGHEFFTLGNGKEEKCWLNYLLERFLVGNRFANGVIFVCVCVSTTLLRSGECNEPF